MKEWPKVLLGDHIDLLTGYPFKSKEYSDNPNDIRLISGYNIMQGYLRWDKINRWPMSKYNGLDEYKLQVNDVVLAMDRPWIDAGLKYSWMKQDDLPCLLVQRTARLRSTGTLDVGFLRHLLGSPEFTSHIKAVLTGTAVPHISPTDIKSFRFSLPPLAEQQKIAEILSTWDLAISLTTRLVAFKQRHKRALMQQLLTGRRRFREFGKSVTDNNVPDEWKQVRLGDVFERVVRKVKGEPEHILSITAGVGYVDQREKFSRIIAGKNLEKYVLLRKGEFSYNKGNSKTYPQGCIYLLERLDEAAVPNVYYSFRAKSQNVVSSIFYKFYFEHGMLNRHLIPIINAGVRNDRLLNLYADNFFKAKILLPPIEEQHRIAGVLQVCTEEIELLKQKLAALKRQKKGLMQKLLTGEVRVKVGD